MKIRFLLPLGAAACLLGVMLAIVAGHVRSAVHDWTDATYRMTEGAYVLTVYPNPDGEAPNAERSAAINAQLRELVQGESVVIVLDALDGDGPRIGLYDPNGRFSGAVITQGRSFDTADFQSAKATAIVSDDSYLVGREDRYIPDGVTVIGYYDPASLPFTSEYVYSLFTQENVHGMYYVDAEDPGLAARFAAALEEGGYVVEGQKLDPSAWSIVQDEPLTYAYEASILLVYGSVLLLCLDWIATNQRRYLIERIYGARPGTFALRALRLVTPTALLGTAAGAGVGVWALGELGTLSVLPGLADVVALIGANVLILTAVFSCAVLTRTSRWGRS
ncbi:MAG: hypothetical protein QM602_07910 [Microbacterium sp.]